MDGLRLARTPVKATVREAREGVTYFTCFKCGQRFSCCNAASRVQSLHMSETPATPTQPARPIIAVTMGDAAGVGPEVCLRLLNEQRWPEESVPVVYGNARILERVAKAINVPFQAKVLGSPSEPVAGPAVYDVPGVLIGQDIAPGRNQAACGHAAAKFIEAAVNACRSGYAAAMVTAPISKRALNLAGIEFLGHTEMIAALTGSDRYAMLLYSEEKRLAVAFATSHQSLRSVPESLSGERIVQVATLLNHHLKLLHPDQTPRLAVLGLNPHAGEEGLFGSEEESIIEPAVARIRQLGIDVTGPLPPDTAFTPAALQRFDGHVALYHDQGGIPFKMAAFDSGVNVTLGLELIRTSPDHGTAYDIAWKGVADTHSFFAAYALAARLAVAKGKAGVARKTSSRRLVAASRNGEQPKS